MENTGIVFDPAVSVTLGNKVLSKSLGEASEILILREYTKCCA